MAMPRKIHIQDNHDSLDSMTLCNRVHSDSPYRGWFRSTVEAIPMEEREKATCLPCLGKVDARLAWDAKRNTERENSR